MVSLLSLAFFRGGEAHGRFDVLIVVISVARLELRHRHRAGLCCEAFPGWRPDHTNIAIYGHAGRIGPLPGDILCAILEGLVGDLEERELVPRFESERLAPLLAVA